MLGENHSLLNEFPGHKELIQKLIRDNQEFANFADQYDQLDAEIRHLELANTPTSDDTMRRMKHDRAVLKDRLYALINAT